MNEVQIALFQYDVGHSIKSKEGMYQILKKVLQDATPINSPKIDKLDDMFDELLLELYKIGIKVGYNKCVGEDMRDCGY